VTAINLTAIPEELRDQAAWVVWRTENRDGKPTKVPYCAFSTTKRASTTDPLTWDDPREATHAAQKARMDGVGYVFSTDDPFVGIDLDKCIDPATGEIAEWAADWVARFDTYAEISPSGTGIHIIAKGALPAAGRKLGGVEVYDRDRYFTMTGNPYPGAPNVINERQEILEELLAEHFTRQAPAAQAKALPPATAGITTDDRELLDKARRAANGAKFSALYDAGDLTGHGEDQSRAVLALLDHLAFWTGRDPERIDRLFRGSALFYPKWDHKRGATTWGAERIQKAVSGCVETYSPNGRHQESRSEPVESGSDSDTEFGRNVVSVVSVSRREEWPAPMESAAFHGIAGDIVNLLLPHTEADPHALLVLFLAGYGSAIGGNAYVSPTADRQTARVWPILVGATGEGRKDTARGEIERLLGLADPTWTDRHAHGLGSGEALVHNVRDAAGKDDPGVTDKRLWLAESEFEGVLSAAKRSGSTMTAHIRTAWDKDTLRVTTRNTAAKATGAHIVITGNITPEELRTALSTTDVANGMANRFLWVCVRRSKLLPRGGRLRTADMEPLAQRLATFIDYGTQQGLLDHDGGFWTLWDQQYPRLSAGHPGLAGKVLGRGAPYVHRIALIYALLDGVKVINRRHLEAALAVWTYCTASALHLFGRRTGDHVADDILRELQAAPEGITRTDIRDMFNRNKSVGAALEALAHAGLAHCTKESSGVGRPTERWHAANAGTNDINDKTTEVPAGTAYDKNDRTTEVRVNGATQSSRNGVKAHA
jgi:hypothetical protein